MLLNTIYFTTALCVLGLGIYIWRYVDAIQRKLTKETPDSFKDAYKDL